MIFTKYKSLKKHFINLPAGVFIICIVVLLSSSTKIIIIKKSLLYILYISVNKILNMDGNRLDFFFFVRDRPPFLISGHVQHYSLNVTFFETFIEDRFQ